MGFFTAFLIATEVTITTKSESEKQYRVVSNGVDLKIQEDTNGDEIGRGTSVELKLKSNYLYLLEEAKLKDLIDNYPLWVEEPIYYSDGQKRDRVNS